MRVKVSLGIVLGWWLLVGGIRYKFEVYWVVMIFDGV